MRVDVVVRPGVGNLKPNTLKPDPHTWRRGGPGPLVGKDNGLAQAVNQKLNQLLPLGHFHAIQQVVPTGIKPLRRISVRIGGSHARENPRQNRIYL